MSRRTSIEVRQKLLDVAGTLFYREGIHAVGISKVISEADVAKATLYAHFGSKEELVAAYLSKRSDEWYQWMEAGTSRVNGSPLEKILAVFDLLEQRFRSPGYRGCPFINAAAEFPPPGLVYSKIEEHRKRVRNLFTKLAVEANLSNVEYLAGSLMFIYDGAMVSAQLDERNLAASNAKLIADDLLRQAESRSN